jgi:cytochrome c biogenesis protein CcmG/thiol:disulfide interchange protein DsbE
VGAKTFVIVMVVVAVIGLLGFGLASKGESTIAIGDAAPDKELPRLDGSGTGRIADYRGQWVLVNFWASWCEPCRAEAPLLERFWRANRARRVIVLGIDLDDATDDARDFVDEFRLTYPQLRDGDGRERRDAYGMTGFPESFLVDPQGRLAAIRRGPVEERVLREEIQPMIDGQPSAPSGS